MKDLLTYRKCKTMKMSTVICYCQYLIPTRFLRNAA